MNKDNQEQQQGTQVDATMVINNLAQELTEKTIQIATLKARIAALESKVK